MNDISAKIVSALKDVLKETYDLDAEAGILNIEIPKDPKMGDYSSTCAMRLAKTLHQNPKMIAETVAEGLKGKLPEAETIEIAGPGFINFRMKKSALASVINTILDAGDSYGRNNTGEGKRILVEWVSANPTGDLHCGHARNAAWGDSICRLLEASGYDVLREYYVNDAGNQIVMLGESLIARYFEYFGKEYPLPADGYHGQDVKDIAIGLAKQDGDKWLTADPKERL